MNEGKFEAKAARSQRDIAVAAGTFAQFSGSASWDTHTLSTDADPTCNDLALQSATNVAPNSPMPVRCRVRRPPREAFSFIGTRV